MPPLSAACAAAVRAVRMRSAKSSASTVRRVDGGAVPDPFAGDDVADPDALEGATQLGDADLQRVHRVDRQRRLRPQPVDEHGGRNGAAGTEEELGEQGAFGGAGQLHRCTVDTDLHRPEQPEAHVVHWRSLRSSIVIVLRGCGGSNAWDWAVF